MPRRALDLTALGPFGRLRALERVGTSASGNAVWRCLCDPELGGCGATHEVQSRVLLAGGSTSCGCREWGADLSGRPFGALTAVQRAPGRAPGTSGSWLWRCSCACGGEAVVPAFRLLNLDVTSCGASCPRSPLRRNHPQPGVAADVLALHAQGRTPAEICATVRRSRSRVNAILRRSRDAPDGGPPCTP